MSYIAANTWNWEVVLMPEMKTDELMKDIETRIIDYSILPWLSDYTEYGSHRPDGPPEGAISFQEIGKWLGVVVVFRWEGTTMDQTTDRLNGDPFYCVVRYDWIGLKENAPSEVKTVEELDAWAIHSLFYVRENTDVGAWGVHEGSFVENLTADGTLTIREVTGKYQDEDPTTLGAIRSIKLDFKSTN